MTTVRSYTSLNRNEYAMSREDDFAQSASVRKVVEETQRSSHVVIVNGQRIIRVSPPHSVETDLYRLAINADEPFRTTFFTDDPDELQALASQSTRQAFVIGYADGKVIAKEPAGYGAWRKVNDALGGYSAQQRIYHGRVPEAVTVDKVSAHHLRDLPEPPLSTTTAPGPHDATEDRLPAFLRWINDEPQDDFEILPYVEGITEAAALGIGISRTAPGCE